MLRSTKKSRRHRNPKSSDEKKDSFFSKKLDENPSPKVQQPFFQAKLQLSQPHDKYEREADAVADRVTSSNPNQSGIPAIGKLSSVQPGSLKPAQMKIRRKAELESTSPQMQEIEEEEPVQMTEEKEETMQMQQEEEEEVQMMEGEEEEEVQMREEEDDDSVQMAELEEEEAVQTQHEVAKHAPGPTLGNRIREKAGRGRSLPGKAKMEMESAFGLDFSEVNIHTDTEAVRMNKELGAQAFTHGKDVYFNSGKYRPESLVGKRLLAHELTHVVQQNSNFVDTCNMSKEFHSS